MIYQQVNRAKGNVYPHLSNQIHPCQPTLRPVLYAVPRSDAQMLLNAFTGIGCDQQMVMNILTHRSSAQIEQIKQEYTSITGKSLIDRTVSELLDPFEYLALCLLYTGPDADAYILRRATKGLGTDDTILVHILCTRSSEQIECIKQSYLRMYKKPLLDAVRSDTSGTYRDMLTHLIQKPRSKDPGDPALAAQQATLGYSRGILVTSPSDKFVPVMGDSSYEHIRLICQSFQQQFGQNIISYMDKFIGNYALVLSSICHYALDPLQYYARYLKTSIVNRSLRDVICLLATRREIDLASILNTYSMAYQSRPEKDIKNAFKETCPQIIDELEMLMGLR